MGLHSKSPCGRAAFVCLAWFSVWSFVPAGSPAAEDAALAHGVIVTRARVRESPPRILLEWPRVEGSGGFWLYRKAPADGSWGAVRATIADADATSYADDDVEAGVAYEYMVETAAPLPRLKNRRASGVLAAGIALPVVDSRGTVLLLVDRTMAADLVGELDRLEEDLVGDGWTVLRHDVERQATVCANATSAEVEAVKRVIRDAYRRAPDDVRAVLLVGRVPIPYSGWLIPDGHDFEAREADTYYALPEATWTDVRDYGGKGLRGNVAGDGKFDQSWFDPSLVRLAVGRVDMSGLPIFGLPEPELLRRYLNKHHAFRQRITPFPPACDTGSGLVGSRTGFGLQTLFDSGMVNPVQGQLSGEIESPRLWSYAEGLAYINNDLGRFFSTRDPQYVFMGCWGSGINYDIEAGKQGMGRPCLAGKGACLTWVCGQPNRSFHWMAIGETIGGCERLAMINGGLYPSRANRNQSNAVFRCLLGDPTLRLHVLAPPVGATISGATLSWEPSPDAAASGFLGYHVLRGPSRKGPFTRLTAAPVRGTSWTDPEPPPAGCYQIRAVRLETTPTGSYHNTSQGALVSRTGADIVCRLRRVAVPEGGTTAFNVKLSSPPPGNVVVTAARTGGAEGIAVRAGERLRFTPATWNDWQTVTLAADRTSGTAAAAGADATITLRADDRPSTTVGAVVEEQAILVDCSSIRVPENDSARFHVRLSGPPAADAVVSIERMSTYSTGERITVASGTTLTFTPADWNRWQPVTVAYADGDEVAVPHNLGSIQAAFRLTAAGFRRTAVQAAGIERHARLTTVAEPAASGTVSPAPAATVACGEPVTISTRPAPGRRFAGWGAGTADGTLVVANPASPETTATVLPWAAGMSLKIAAKFVADEGEAATLITVLTDRPLVAVPEAGAGTLRVKLSARPAADVIVTPRSGRPWDADLAVQSGSRLVFTPENWDAWQAIELTAAEDDDDVDGRGLVILEGSGLLPAHACAVERDTSVRLTTFPGRGGMATTPAGRTAVARGRPIAITASAAPGHAFDHWAVAEGRPVIADPQAAQTTVTLDATAGIRAIFRRDEPQPEPAPPLIPHDRR